MLSVGQIRGQSWEIGDQYGSPYQAVELDHPPKCEKITIPMCEGIGYNYTSMELSPFHHKNQKESGLEAHQFYPLVQLGCSDDARAFLCALYTPVCMADYNKFLPPCRFLCERARDGCLPIMKEYGFQWPEKMECSKFPNHEPCNHFNRRHIIPATPLKPLVKSPPKPQMCQNCKCNSKTFIDLTQKSYNIDNLNTADMITWNVGGMEGCAMPCKSPYLSTSQRQFLNSWIFAWAIGVAFSTILVQITFLLDLKRFKYPERPIVYLSLCYLFVAIGYIISYIVGEEKVACSSLDSSRLINSGGTSYCNVVFVLTYYFGMASAIWWVMLTFAWFLAAGMKWSCEAISGYSMYMHVIAWSLPGLKTIIILSTNAVDGDPFLGTCGVGNTNIQQMHTFILAPLVVYLSAGGLFLMVGFVSLFRIRNTMKKRSDQTDKLETLIVKIAIFSVLYMIPASIQVACYFYESELRLRWEYYYNCDKCGVDFNQLAFLVILLRPFMSLLVGIASATWICCDKTIQTWQRCCLCRADSDSTISTTSTLTTHDTCLLPNPHATFDRHNIPEFHYEYYNHGHTNKPLL